MRLLLTLLLALAALSGCIGDDDSETTDGPDAGADPGETGDAMEEPEPVTHSCTTDVGVPVISLSGAANVGGCQLVEITSTQQVVEVNPADACNIQADLDGDGLADEEVTVGAVYESGASITAFCDPPAVDAESSISLVRA